MNYMYVT